MKIGRGKARGKADGDVRKESVNPNRKLPESPWPSLPPHAAPHHPSPLLHTSAQTPQARTRTRTRTWSWSKSSRTTASRRVPSMSPSMSWRAAAMLVRSPTPSCGRGGGGRKGRCVYQGRETEGGENGNGRRQWVSEKAWRVTAGDGQARTSPTVPPYRPPHHALLPLMPTLPSPTTYPTTHPTPPHTMHRSGPRGKKSPPSRNPGSWMSPTTVSPSLKMQNFMTWGGREQRALQRGNNCRGWAPPTLSEWGGQRIGKRTTKERPDAGGAGGLR